MAELGQLAGRQPCAAERVVLVLADASIIAGEKPFSQGTFRQSEKRMSYGMAAD